MSSNKTAIIQQIKCPEFNRIIHDLTGDVFDSLTCRYDIILGRRDIAKLGIKLDFSTNHPGGPKDAAVPKHRKTIVSRRIQDSSSPQRKLKHECRRERGT